MHNYNEDVDRLIAAQRKQSLGDRILIRLVVVAAIAISMFLMFAGTACSEQPPVIGPVASGARSGLNYSVQDGPTCAIPTTSIQPHNRSAISTNPEDEQLHRLTDMVLDVVCGKRVNCREERALGVLRGVSDIIAACKDEGAVGARCMALLVTAAAESGFRAHPGCGVSEGCAAACDDLATGKARQSCLVACAKKEGVNVDRALRCNDNGTSRGPFQMKPLTIERCGEYGQPHSFYSAGRCYLRLVAASEPTAAGVCGVKGKDVWRVAWKRVGAGPFVRGSAAPQCQKSRYALRGERWSELLAVDELKASTAP